MSRIGNQPIELPKDVAIQIEGSGVPGTPNTVKLNVTVADPL